MSDYGTMQARIANELVRTDLTTEIQDAIKSAIRFYASEKWYFTEARATINTVADTEYYGLPGDFHSLYWLGITVNDRYYQLEQKSAAYLDELNWSNSTFTGQPYYFALFDDNFRLYPVPNDAYALTLAYAESLDDLSASADSNAWMTGKGEELIRTHAKVDLLESVIRGPEASNEATRLRGREQEVLRQLRQLNTRRRSTRRLRAAC